MDFFSVGAIRRRDRLSRLHLAKLVEDLEEEVLVKPAPALEREVGPHPLVAHAQQPDRGQRIGVLVAYAEGDSEMDARLADRRGASAVVAEP
jgi:hypothetical protein